MTLIKDAWRLLTHLRMMVIEILVLMALMIAAGALLSASILFALAGVKGFGALGV